MKNILVCSLLSAGLATACSNRHEPVQTSADYASGNTVGNNDTNLADSNKTRQLSDQMVPNNTGPVVLPGASQGSTQAGEKKPRNTSWLLIRLRVQ